MWTQTYAIFADAFRELQSKKLFWITIALSGLIVGSLAALGINSKGLTVLWWEIAVPGMNTETIPKPLFYKSLFVNFYVPIWLAWGAIILALVSVSGIIPDFLAGGAVELTLSKPVSRVRLFLTKFASGMLFVAAQVAVFCVVAFLTFGLRGGGWEPRLFLALPIVLLFFSYLYSINTLLGLLTRSTIAALLLTLLCWAFFFVLNTGDNVCVSFREASTLRAERAQKSVEKLSAFARKSIDANRAKGIEPIPGGVLPEGVVDELEAVNPVIRERRAVIQEARKDAQDWAKYARIASGAKAIFPKTQETIGLLDKALISDQDQGTLDSARSARRKKDGEDEDRFFTNRPHNGPDAEHVARVERVMRARSSAWVIGTSVVFSGLVLGAACVIFARKDF